LEQLVSERTAELLQANEQLRQEILERNKVEEALRTSEERYRAIFQGAAEGILVADQETMQLKHANKAISDMLGYTPEELTNLGIEDIHPKEFLDGVINEFQTHARGDKARAEDIPCLRKDGTIFFVDVSTTLLQIDGVPCNVGFFWDITKRKKVAEALRESEQRFRTVFNNAAVGIDVLDGRGRFIEVNSALARMLGYSKEELAEIGPLDLTHPDDLEESKECLAQLVGGKTDSYRFEKRYVRKDGSIIVADVMVSKILDRDGNYAATIGVVSDITDRRKAEYALQVKTHDLGERIKELNCLYNISQLRERGGMSLEETFHAVADLIPPAWQFPEITCARIIWEGREFKSESFGFPVAKQLANIVVHGAVVGSLEVGYLEDRPKSDEGPFLKEERDLINAIVERLGRMVERSKAEEELQKYQAQLEQLVEKRTQELVEANRQLIEEIGERKRKEEIIKESAAALERSNKDLEQFAYVAAHDLREPLVGVAAYLKLLERRIGNNLETEPKKYLSKSLNTVLRMDFLIRTLLEYSRVSDHKPQVEKTDCNVCLSQALANLKSAIKESGATITSDRLPVVLAIPLHITQLFQNLVANAIKFRGTRPVQIHVGVSSGDSDQQFWVRDNGIGIEPPHFDRIFQIFQRIDHSSGPVGTGIGLATCKKVVERHGGRIWVESEPGRGSTFWFTLPADVKEHCES
jgi:PAS domain S-box-containing protein